MKKMYFAMIPKRSFLESAAIVAGVGAGLIYGAKYLLGEEQFNEYKNKLKDQIFSTGSQEFSAASATPASQAFEDADPQAKDEDAIVERIRRAAEKGVEKIIK